MNMIEFEKGNKAYARERIAVGGASVGITEALVNDTADLGTTKFRRPAQAEVVVVSGDILYTVDGTTPTAVIGVPAPALTAIWLDGFAMIRDFRAIQGTGPAVLEVTLFR